MERFRQENPGSEVICCETPRRRASERDALVLVTEWPQYRDLDWEQVAGSMRSAIMLDGRHALDRARMTRAGFPLRRAWLGESMLRQILERGFLGRGPGKSRAGWTAPRWSSPPFNSRICSRSRIWIS